jgi:Family of unknown function (DUF6525)
MITNSRTGSYRTTRENVMRAFDSLPRDARAALANSVDNWVPQPLVTRYRRGILPDAAALVERIEFWNAAELAKREHHRARAIGAYKGNKPASNSDIARAAERLQQVLMRSAAPKRGER